jgi:hypothetical protein
MLKFFQIMKCKFHSKILRHALIVVTFILISTMPVNYLVSQSLDTFSQVSNYNSDKLKFDLLHEASKNNYEAWTGNVWGTVGFLVIVLGWLLTSKGSRIFLSKNNAARKVAITVVAIIAVINMLLNLDLARRSAEIQEDIGKNEYVLTHNLETIHYGHYIVPFRNAIFSDILVGTIFAIITFFLISLAKWIEPSGES